MRSACLTLSSLINLWRIYNIKSSAQPSKLKFSTWIPNKTKPWASPKNDNNILNRSVASIAKNWYRNDATLAPRVVAASWMSRKWPSTTWLTPDSRSTYKSSRNPNTIWRDWPIWWKPSTARTSSSSTTASSEFAKLCPLLRSLPFRLLSTSELCLASSSSSANRSTRSYNSRQPGPSQTSLRGPHSSANP